MARIPEKTVAKDEREQLHGLEERLSKEIFGQQEAVQSGVLAVKRSRAGLRDGDKPIASFLFVGPTGVGKTELAKVLASQLGMKLLRFDMSEYQEKHTVSRLIGAPPGYVGFEDGGLLTDALRKEPQSVVLLDEIEKAHSDIYNILLQVMDYAIVRLFSLSSATMCCESLGDSPSIDTGAGPMDRRSPTSSAPMNPFGAYQPRGSSVSCAGFSTE